MTDQKKPEDAIPDADTSAGAIDGPEPATGPAPDIADSVEPEVAAERGDGSGDAEPTRGAADSPSPAAPAAPAAETRPAASTKPSKSTAGSAAARPTGSDSLDQPRYVDDPVSKWWVAIVIAVFGLIFAGAIFFGGGGLLSGIFEGDESTTTPSLAASPSLTASPPASPSSASPSSASSSSASTPAVTTDPAPAATPEPLPEETSPSASPAG